MAEGRADPVAFPDPLCPVDWKSGHLIMGFQAGDCSLSACLNGRTSR